MNQSVERELSRRIRHACLLPYYVAVKVSVQGNCCDVQGTVT
jgi:hypothetical protein